MSGSPGPEHLLVRLVRRVDSSLLAGLLLVTALAAVFLVAQGSAGQTRAPLLFAPPTDTATATPTPTATLTPTPTVTPSATPTSTATGTPSRTPTVPPTATLTLTLTATITPSSTPRPVSTPRVEPLDLSGLYAGMAFTVRGAGSPGEAIALYDNGILQATAVVNGDGQWQIDVPGLSVGSHALLVIAIQSDGRSSELAPVGFAIVLEPTASLTATWTPSATPTPSPTLTPSVTPTATPTALPTLTPTATPTPSVTPTPTATVTRTPRPTSSPSLPVTATGSVQAALPTAAPLLLTATLLLPPLSPTLPPSLPPLLPPLLPSPTMTPISPTPTPLSTATMTFTPSPAPVRPVILDPAAGTPVAAGAVTFSGQGEPGDSISLVDQNGSLLGNSIVGPSGEWTATADLSLLQGEATIFALALDATGRVLAQSVGVTITVAPQLAPPTGGEIPESLGPSWVNIGLALLAVLGLALLVGGLVLRQAGSVLGLRERDEDRS